MQEVFRYWYIPALLALAGAGYMLYKYNKYIPVYPASITFSIDEDESGSSSALSGMLGQFGLGGMRPNRYNFDKIMALSKSRRIIQESLFAKVTIDGKQDFLANHLIRIYDLKLSAGEGREDESLIFTHDSLPAFSRAENEAVISIYHFIIGPPEDQEKALLLADYNEDSNIMTLSAVTIDETLSLELAKRSFQALSNYYVTKAIEKAKKTFDIVSTKRDSVLGELRSAEYQLANFDDRNRGLIMRTDQVTRLRLQRDVAALGAMYAEILKNTEAADFNLRNKTPFIQVIDTPIPPINAVEQSLLRKLLIGMIIGGLIGSVLVIGRKAYRDMMTKGA